MPDARLERTRRAYRTSDLDGDPLFERYVRSIFDMTAAYWAKYRASLDANRGSPTPYLPTPEWLVTDVERALGRR